MVRFTRLASSEYFDTLPATATFRVALTHPNMTILELAQTKDFVKLWKEAFSDAAGLWATFETRGEKPRAHAEDRSYWLQIREPLEGVRLISAEFPFTYGPARLYLRAWAYQPEGDAAFDAIVANPFVYAGEEVQRLVGEGPKSGWRGELTAKDTSIRGVRHMIYLTDLENVPPSAVGSALFGIVKEFCEYIARTVPPTALAPVASTASEPPAELPEEPEILVGDIAAIDQDPRFQDLPPPIRRALANARIGQGSYRKRMLALWGGQCALTGCEVEEVLIASHARPFAMCDTSAECLDEYNGLLLSANLDRLFDRGLIAFQNDGAVLQKAGADLADLVQADRLRTIHPRHAPYLTWHRKHFGFE